jgi:hypothetical protein
MGNSCTEAASRAALGRLPQAVLKCFMMTKTSCTMQHQHITASSGGHFKACDRAKKCRQAHTDGMVTSYHTQLAIASAHTAKLSVSTAPLSLFFVMAAPPSLIARIGFWVVCCGAFELILLL